MNKSILLVNTSRYAFDLGSAIPGEHTLVQVTTPAEAATVLNQQEAWCVILATYPFPAPDELALHKLTANQSEAVPLLIAAEEDIAEALAWANANSFFRVIPLNTTPETWQTILADAVIQYQLKQAERLHQQKIAVLSITDTLTGCFTRAYIQEHLGKELKRSARFAHHLSVILCDIDALRDINDTFGYQAGDALLLGFTRTVMRTIRHDIDTITRWGEDEFLIVLPETTIRGAGRVATRLQELFAACQCTLEPGHSISGSASFGVTSFSPEIPNRNAEPEQLILIASRCLIQAKAAGGNQILCCP